MPVESPCPIGHAGLLTAAGFRGLTHRRLGARWRRVPTAASIAASAQYLHDRNAWSIIHAAGRSLSIRQREICCRLPSHRTRSQREVLITVARSSAILGINQGVLSRVGAERESQLRCTSPGHQVSGRQEIRDLMLSRHPTHYEGAQSA